MLYILKRRLQLFLARFCRPFYCILFSPGVDNWICTRYICAYFFGICVAYILWMVLLLNFRFSLETEFVILAIMMAVIGVGYVFTTSIKCVTLLILVGIAGKSGRSYLRALSFAYIISGPITNLAMNGGEVVRVFACATTLTYNLTKTRIDLMTRPFQNTLTTMKDDIKSVKDGFGKMNHVLHPIHQEVESDLGDTINANNQAANRIQNNYRKKFKARCKQQLDMGKKRCRSAFARAHGECKRKFPRIVQFFFCWPFRINFICDINLFGNKEKICDSTKVLPNSFGESYVQLSLTENELYKNGSDAQVKYKIHNTMPDEAVRNAEQAADLITKEFKRRKRIFDAIMDIMQTFFSIIFIKVIIESISYHKQYLQQIDFDNIYLSEYFRNIDENRKINNKTSLLPLKKLEKKYLMVSEHACKYTNEESRAIIFHLLQFSLEIVAACFFLLFDFLVVNILDIIRVKSFMSYMQEGEHIIHFQINGVGLMARLLRRTLGNFNMHEKVSTYLTNEACLPQPNILPNSFYLELVAMYLIIVFLICKSSLLMRLRHLICGFFYRKREKRRILYLYNSLLRQRRVIFQTMLQKAESNITKRNLRHRMNIVLQLRLGCPVCGWLKYFKIAQHKCLICDAFEDKDFVICENIECQMAYCLQCWNELEKTCINCKQASINN